jgi:replication factor C subunit 1
MDEYYLSKEDWETIAGLGVGGLKDPKILTAAKVIVHEEVREAAHFWFCEEMLIILLRYNASEHPIPFHKAQDLGKAQKKL